MTNKRFNLYYLLSCLGVMLVSYYPLSMGIRVIVDMIKDGTVLKENYPKYIIPYTPISVAIIIGVILMPLCIKLFKQFAFLAGSAVSLGVFVVTELLLENKVVITTVETIEKVVLEDWQMYMCYIPPESIKEITTYKTQTAVDILIGEYNPAFKLHFYIISIILILSILNSIYGIGRIVKTGDKKRLVPLIVQAVCFVTFLALCILACFTAFWRDGSLQVSAISAILMTVFFVLFGVTGGVFVGSYFIGKRKLFSTIIPSLVASIMTFLMYIGEMILLNGNLYSFGNSFIFKSINGIVLSAFDLITVVLSGVMTAYIFKLLNHKRVKSDNY